MSSRLTELTLNAVVQVLNEHDRRVKTASVALHLGLLLLLPTAVRAAAVAILPPTLKVDGAGWQHYAMGDSPEGGTMGWLRDETATIVGEVTLPQALRPGRIFVFLKAINYDERVSLQIACGGGESEVITPRNGDWNGYWTDAIPVQVQSASRKLTLTLTRASTGTEKLLVRGLYVTSDPLVAVDGNDTVLRNALPTAVALGDRYTPIVKNRVPNSSFEVGLGHGWGFVGANNRDYSTGSLCTQTQAYDGRASVRLPDWSKLVSRLIRVRPNRKHTLSVWVRPDSGGTLQLSLYNVNEDRPGVPPVTRLQQRFDLKPGWQRLSLNGDLQGPPSPDFQIRLETTSSAVWVDAVQLGEGELSPYEPAEPLEIGLVGQKPGGIFIEGEPVTMQLLARNSTGRPITSRIFCEVYDYLNRKVMQKTVAINVPRNATSGRLFDLATGRRGIFRAVIWAEDRDGTEEEVVYSIVPRPRLSGPDPSSMIGIHADASAIQYEALKRLGVKWQRVMSPERWFRWTNAEPSPGKFIWHDDEARKTVAHGFTILGNLGYWPQWADRSGKPDLDAWEAYVHRIVDHYKPWVKYWEVWNEPIHEFPASFYAELLKRAVRAVRRADPHAKIVGIGGSYSSTWCLEVLQALEGPPSRYMDYLSTHLYPANSDPFNPADDSRAVREFRDGILLPHRMPVWNTETGLWCLGFHKGPNSGFRSPGEPLWPHQHGIRYYRGSGYQAARLARNFLDSLGHGFSRYFYYDSRFHAAPDYYKTHCTIFEYDDTVRPKGIAYGILAYLFDHSLSLGDVSSDPRTRIYLFDRAGTPVVGLFTADERIRTITLPLATSRFRVYDLMGSRVAAPGSVVRYGREPVYLEGLGGLSASQLRTAFQHGRVAEAGDTTAPNLSISECPRGATRDRSVRVRWIALDETSVPHDNTTPRALVYSFRLAGHSDRWSDWTPATVWTYRDLPARRYRFEVRARDAAGNLSKVASREFWTGRSSPSSGAVRPYRDAALRDPRRRRLPPRPPRASSASWSS